MTLHVRVRPRRGIVIVAALALVAVMVTPAGAYPRPGATERVSLASDGTEANGPSHSPAISADDRYVAFWSNASNLVPGDTNEAWDVFVHDRTTDTTERVSVASDGAEGNAASQAASISADGRYVAFQSQASNLVAGDTNGVWDVFVRDRATGTTERVSVASDGTEASGGLGSLGSLLPSISADGRYVAFQSQASNLVPEKTTGAWDVFVHDRQTGITERVSVASDGTEADGFSLEPSISADGRYVAFSSKASNLVPGATNVAYDVFVHDRATSTTERVSVSSSGAGANDGSSAAAISADGRYVAFQSQASNLVPAATTDPSWPPRAGVFVHDRTTNITERVSVASDGAEANDTAWTPSISADGRYVAFHSPASNLVAGDTNGVWDVFVRDRATGTTERVSVASDATEANAGSSSSKPTVISADGRHVVFSSSASNLVPGDTNGTLDVFVRDRGGSLGVVGTPSLLEVPGGVGVSGQATFAGATLAEATDPDDDGTSVGPAGAEDVGAELTGAALIYRPEQEDLLVRLDLASLPPVAGGLPAVLYGADLRVGDTRYEVRALRAAGTTDPPRVPHVALYRCDPGCTEHAPLTGSFGTTGDHVLVSVPLSALDAAEGTQLTDLRAFTAAGEATPGALLILDEVALPPSVIPVARVQLGIAPASTPQDQVAFTVDAERLAGGFSGTVSTTGLSPGSHRVWTRACLGEVCGAATFKEVAV